MIIPNVSGSFIIQKGLTGGRLIRRCLCECKNGVILIGKIMILSFLDSEEYIMDRVRSIIGNENTVEHIKIMPRSVRFFKDLKIQLKEQEVYRKDKRISLSRQEFLALRFLTEHPGWVCTKEQIYGAVCEEKFMEDIDNIIYCLIRSLRKKLETDPRHPEYIQTIRGVGYKFVIPEE